MDKTSQNDYIDGLEIPDSELRNNYDHLQNLYKSALKCLEEKNQEIYQYKRDRETFSVMEKEFQQELDSQTELLQKIKQLEKQLQLLNEEKATLHKTYEEQLDQYIAEVKEKNNVITGLNQKYDDILKNKSAQNVEVQEELQMENIKLKNEITALEEILIEMKHDFEVSQEEKLNGEKNIAVSLFKNFSILDFLKY